MTLRINKPILFLLVIISRHMTEIFTFNDYIPKAGFGVVNINNNF